MNPGSPVFLKKGIMTDIPRDDVNAESQDAHATARAEADARRLARRRFVQIGLAAGPVVLTIKGRPAWAQSGGGSGTLSSQMSSQPGQK